MNINKKARELMCKYPNAITPNQLAQEIPDENFRMMVFRRMCFFANITESSTESRRILGNNLIHN